MLYRLFISILVTVLICQFIFKYVECKLYNEGRYKNLFIDSTYYNILFLGSSRTLHHINPLIIDSVLKVNSYNAGIEGVKLFQLEIVLDAYLQSHPPPKIIILNLDYFSFLKYSKKSFVDYETYYFFLSNKAILSCFIKNKDKVVSALKLFPFLKLSLQSDIKRGEIVGNIFFKKEYELNNYKGYISIDGKFNNNEKNRHISFISDSLVNYLENIEHIVNICKKLSIKLILIHPPIYNVSLYTEKEMLYHNQFLSLVDSISYMYNLPFLNADTLSLSYNKDLFRDLNHLNSKGADLYSNILAHQLKTLLKKDNIK